MNQTLLTIAKSPLQLIKLTNTAAFIDFVKAKSHLAKDIPQFSYWVFFLSPNFAPSSVTNQNSQNQSSKLSRKTWPCPTFSTH